MVPLGADLRVRPGSEGRHAGLPLLFLIRIVMYDVYAYGMIAPSTLYVIKDKFPAAGKYAEVSHVFHSTGGEAANGAYVLSRLGVSTQLDGNWLGDDDASQRTIAIMEAQGVHCDRITRKKGYKPITEMVIADPGTRTIFATYQQFFEAGVQWNEPSTETIRQSKIVCLDPFFPPQSEHIAEICVESGIPYVTVDVHPDLNIARDAAVVIISEEFLLREFSALNSGEPVNKEQLFRTYAAQCAGLIMHTYGSAPIIYGRRHEDPQYFSPFSVDAKDTTGAGDSFRAGVIYGLLQGQHGTELLRTASAVAGLVCERFPGVLQSPTEPEVEEFLKRH